MFVFENEQKVYLITKWHDKLVLKLVFLWMFNYLSVFFSYSLPKNFKLKHHIQLIHWSYTTLIAKKKKLFVDIVLNNQNLYTPIAISHIISILIVFFSSHCCFSCQWFSSFYVFFFNELMLCFRNCHCFTITFFLVFIDVFLW